MTYPETDQIQHLVAAAQHIVIMQADNPDADSLGSALALEHILGDLGKKTWLYCAVDMPGYLHYLPGWDRVNNELPSTIDLSIIVDASTITLFEKFEQSVNRGWVASKPCIVLDHHQGVSNLIPFATVMINDATKSSAGEVIYSLSRDCGWVISLPAQECVLTAILGDTQGLSNNLARPATYRIVADMIDAGIDRPKLEDARREFSKMPLEIFRYKADLIARTELSADGRLATVTIPYQEIKEYSPLYNPAPLIQGDMLQTRGVRATVVFKVYQDGRITGAIRCNPGGAIGVELAEHFGGGGHPYASGFKVVDGRPFNELKSECIQFATELLDKLQPVI
jgi:phosphoesterase RecJ-like protein